MNASGPFRPVAACGRKTQTTLSHSSSVGQVALRVVSVSGFSVGDPIFTSSAGGAQFQCHGPMASIDADKKEIVVAWGLARDRSPGDKLWTPTKAVMFRRGATDRIRRVRNTGARAEVSRGGQVYTTRTADAFETLEWVSTAGSAADYEDWRRFIVNDRHEGIDSFTLAYWDYLESGAANQSKCAEARWAGPDLTFDAADGLPRLARYTLLFHIVNWDAYVEE